MKHARRDLGEICVYFKPNISKCISVIDWPNNEDGVILKIDVFFDLVQDLTSYHLALVVK